MFVCAVVLAFVIFVINGAVNEIEEAKLHLMTNPVPYEIKKMILYDNVISLDEARYINSLKGK